MAYLLLIPLVYLVLGLVLSFPREIGSMIGATISLVLVVTMVLWLFHRI